MEEITIKNLAELDDSFLDQAVKIFVESFYQHLRHLSNDKAQLVDLFNKAFVKKHFYVALLNEKVLGLIAYSTQTSHAQIHDKKTLQKTFGNIRGGFAYNALGEKPIPIGPNQAYIEDVATASEARGKGIATKLITHLIETLPYTEYTLEVIDTNVNAVRLYEKLGFVVFKKQKRSFFEIGAGFNEKLYMIKKLP